MKKLLIGLVFSAVSGACLAQNVPAQYADLPQLPDSSRLSNEHIGGHFILEQNAEKKPVVFVGFSREGNALAYPLVDIPESKIDMDGAVALCASKGEGWAVPSIGEFMLLRPYVKDSVVGYLPGNHWTSTNAPCLKNCPKPERFFVVYDPLSGNQGNSYSLINIIKSYPSCVHRF
jgi:hypothetical protein